jgi:hypothetical protein
LHCPVTQTSRTYRETYSETCRVHYSSMNIRKLAIQDGRQIRANPPLSPEHVNSAVTSFNHAHPWPDNNIPVLPNHTNKQTMMTTVSMCTCTCRYCTHCDDHAVTQVCNGCAASSIQYHIMMVYGPSSSTCMHGGYAKADAAMHWQHACSAVASAPPSSTLPQGICVARFPSSLAAWCACE